MLKKNLEKILSDNISGSSELVFNINRLFKKNINDKSMMRNSLKEIKIKMENFEAVMKYVTQINKLL